MRFYRQYGKRIFDLIAVSCVSCIALPLMLLIWGVALICIGRPVLFRQLRPGLKEKPFLLLKFRTMSDTRNANGQLLPDAERLTKFGRWLRATSLDELPELFNVFKGDMSLVGPRPLHMEYLSRYSPEQARRHEVKPGLTGWAQVNGRNAITWDKRFALDIWYVDNLSWRGDCFILLKTVWIVLSGRGINQPGHSTMPEFMGQSGSASKQI